MLSTLLYYGFLALLSYFLLRRLLDTISVGSLASKAVFISGCDSGFGYLLALKCIRAGMTVFAGCLTEEGMVQLEKECEEGDINGGTKGVLHAIPLDVRSQKSVDDAKRAVAEILGDGGRLYALVNNAGVVGLSVWDDWLRPSDYEDVWQVNTMGVIRVTHAFKSMVKRSRWVVFRDSPDWH